MVLKCPYCKAEFMDTEQRFLDLHIKYQHPEEYEKRRPPPLVAIKVEPRHVLSSPPRPPQPPQEDAARIDAHLRDKLYEALEDESAAFTNYEELANQIERQFGVVRYSITTHTLRRIAHEERMHYERIKSLLEDLKKGELE